MANRQKKRKEVSLGNGVKIAGQEFSRGSENIACSEAEACKQVKQKKRRANNNKE